MPNFHFSQRLHTYRSNITKQPPTNITITTTAVARRRGRESQIRGHVIRAALFFIIGHLFFVRGAGTLRLNLARTTKTLTQPGIPLDRIKKSSTSVNDSRLRALSKSPRSITAREKKLTRCAFASFK